MVKIDTLSDEDPENVKASVEEALSEAVSDGTVGNLNVEPHSINVKEPHVEEAKKGNNFYRVCLYNNELHVRILVIFIIVTMPFRIQNT